MKYGPLLQSMEEKVPNTGTPSPISIDTNPLALVEEECLSEKTTTPDADP
jgi:hypothetical protein